MAISEEQLKEMFEANFERLRTENGHSLSPDVKEAAWLQVQMYWRKLNHIASGVTETEVKLNLPNQKTKKGRLFCIEGVVDIIREANRITMYDIKTHEPEYVRANIESYCGQINVYAFIWQRLQGQRLDETAIIATPIPHGLQEAIRHNDPAEIEAAMNKWEPLIPIKFDTANVKQTIGEFADIVDQIEDHNFGPAPLIKLEERGEDRSTFATRVCRNCDARFSCNSYRDYARKNKDRSWRKFADFYDLQPNEEEIIDRVEALSQASVNLSNLQDDI